MTRTPAGTTPVRDRGLPDLDRFEVLTPAMPRPRRRRWEVIAIEGGDRPPKGPLSGGSVVIAGGIGEKVTTLLSQWWLRRHAVAAGRSFKSTWPEAEVIVQRVRR